MPCCVIKHCKSSSQKPRRKEGISFHKFPANAALRKEWTSIVRKSRKENEWRASKFCVVCSLHFKDEDFYIKNDRRFIKKQSKPSQLLYKVSPSPQILDVGVKSKKKTQPHPSENVLGTNYATFSSTGVDQLFAPHNENSPIDFDIHDSDLDSSESDTPRKYQLKKELRKHKTLLPTVQRLKQRNASLQNILKELKDKNLIDYDFHKQLCDNIIETELFHNLQMRSPGKKQLKYSSAMRKFCLTLNFYSPKGYDYVRKSFNSCLPHPNNLTKWYTHSKSEPGFTQEAFIALERKAKASPNKLICGLMFDEMPLRQQKLWDGKRYIGIVDMGDEITESTSLASQALVFMLVGINCEFKIPLGYFLINNLNGEQKSNLIKLCLMKCHESRVKVVSLTFDGDTTNLTAVELLGCSISDVKNMKTTFRHPSDDSEVVCFLDHIHVIKLLRNQLEANKQFINKDKQAVDWGYLVKLNKLQEDDGLQIANKLSKGYILFRNEIMKIKLATQTLCGSVAAAMQVCRSKIGLPEFQQSQPTEEFIQLMNDTSDVFNTRSRAQFGYKKPLHEENIAEIYALLDHLQNYIQSLQIKSVTKRKVIKNGRPSYEIMRFFKKVIEAKCKAGFLGILMNITSLKSLCQRLIEEEKCISFLPTYNLSQDHLEIFFGCVRLGGSQNDNPNVKQFKNIYKQILRHLEMRSPETGNCVPLESVATLRCTSATQVINATSSSYRHETEDTENTGEVEQAFGFLKGLSKEVDYLAQHLDASICHDTKKYIVGYIAGSLINYVRKMIKCETCLLYLITTDRHDFHKLIGLRNNGGLMYASADTFEVCAVAETEIRRMLKENVVITTRNDYSYITARILKCFIGNHKSIFMTLEDEHQCYGADHKVNLIKILIENFLRIRLHYKVKLETRENSSTSYKKKIYKLVQNKCSF